MAAYTAAQIRRAEEPLLAAGVPLMQRAADALAAEIVRLLPPRGRVLLLVGGGNNGGDALYAGQRLLRLGHDVLVVRTSSHAHEEGLEAARGAGAVFVDPDGVAEAAAGADVIVDGILGTGTSVDPALRGRARDVVAAVREARPSGRVVAVDLPSGVDPDSGAAPDGLVLPASVTVTFGGMKRGLLREPAKRLAGRVVVADIGLGETLRALADDASA
jgi:hydroxyethylthiazole kinase-like uncharacterized protein yjeF